MIAPSLHKAAAVSFLLHITFFVLMTVYSRKVDILSPKVYTVTIVAPDAARKASPPTVTIKQRSVEAAPLKESAVEVKPPVEKRAANKPDEDIRHISESLKAIKARKKDEEYISGKLSRIEAQKKLQGIRQNAAAMEEKSNAADSAEERANVIEQYKQIIIESIYDAWLFPEMELKNIDATVSITVMKDGRIVINRIEKPSGNRLFDSSTLKAIYKASPVEPPPFGENIEIGVNFIPHEK